MSQTGPIVTLTFPLQNGNSGTVMIKAVSTKSNLCAKSELGAECLTRWPFILIQQDSSYILRMLQIYSNIQEKYVVQSS